ncbi:hypothetical protein NMY22_g1133 [Coprinellus aureogranulatus]|nr:hypothetical protein NMY22_g1133 [Coprinellus aureogranulatus]
MSFLVVPSSDPSEVGMTIPSMGSKSQDNWSPTATKPLENVPYAEKCIEADPRVQVELDNLYNGNGAAQSLLMQPTAYDFPVSDDQWGRMEAERGNDTHRAPELPLLQASQSFSFQYLDGTEEQKHNIIEVLHSLYGQIEFMSKFLEAQKILVHGLYDIVSNM